MFLGTECTRHCATFRKCRRTHGMVLAMGRGQLGHDVILIVVVVGGPKFETGNGSIRRNQVVIGVCGGTHGVHVGAHHVQGQENGPRSIPDGMGDKGHGQFDIFGFRLADTIVGCDIQSGLFQHAGILMIMVLWRGRIQPLDHARRLGTSKQGHLIAARQRRRRVGAGGGYCLELHPGMGMVLDVMRVGRRNDGRFPLHLEIVRIHELERFLGTRDQQGGRRPSVVVMVVVAGGDMPNVGNPLQAQTRQGPGRLVLTSCQVPSTQDRFQSATVQKGLLGH